jgi:hypothetical protein
MDTVTIAVLVASPVAAVRWARLVGRDAITGPVRNRLRNSGPVAEWVLSGWECVACSTLQFAAVVVTALFASEASAVVAELVVAALTIGQIALILDPLISRDSNQLPERPEGPLFRVTQTRVGVGGTDVLLQPVDASSVAAIPNQIGDVSIIAQVEAVAQTEGWASQTTAVPPNMDELA